MDRLAAASAEDPTLLFRKTESRFALALHAAIVEKDFWVCWALRRLFGASGFRPHLILKGGTSLSKAYKAIDRLSEDVDLSLSRRDLGFVGDHDPEQAGISRKEARRRLEALVQACKETVREKLLPVLRSNFASVLGPAGWTVELDADDPQTVLFAYPASDVSDELTYVRPVIRLEMEARSDDWPADDAGVKPNAAEIFPEVFSVPAAKAQTLAAERTFWEKATLLHAEYHRPLDKAARARHARHYYDLARLATQPIGEKDLQRVDLPNIQPSTML